MDRKKLTGIIVFIVTILVVIGIVVAYYARFRGIQKEAKDYYSWAEQITTFTVESDCATKEEFLRELIRLSEWDGEILDRLSSTYEERAYSTDFLANGSENIFASRTELVMIAFAKELYRLQMIAEESWKQSLDTIFDGDAEKYGITRKSVEQCHKRGFTEQIAKTARFAEKGKGASAFEYGTYELSRDDVLPMDIAYELYPEVIEEGCEEYQKDALRNDSHFLLDNAIWRTELFSERYGYEPKNLSRVKARKESKVASERASKRRTSSSSSSRKIGGTKTIDPEDYDIEGYYEDNRDLYDSNDDAYDGFLDDEDAWGDY